MHFLPDVYVTCRECKGMRFSRETLEIAYRTKSIADVLEMRVSEALAFFENFPRIVGQLATLDAVGLGYITLGQNSTTLSGGEAQRVKLAAELGKRSTGRTLYVLDEPTTGLHFADIQRLLDVLNRLIDMGNTVLVVEHNFQIIKSADWVIDLGPEGGDAGGYIIAEGTPEDVAKVPASYTGQYLVHYLNGKRSTA
jgi:excinuclease ABC subunit A